MLQQTRVEAVLPYFERFVTELPDTASLADAAPERLLALWAGLGYYSRARNLHRAAKIIMRDFGGELPASYSALRSLPGLGEYSAGAIASIAFGIGVPAVDGNVLRVVSRVLAIEQDITRPAVRRQITKFAKEALPHDRPGDFNQALMELGAVVCVPNAAPVCGVCPFTGVCEARKQNVAESLPHKPEKPLRRLLQYTVFLVKIEGKTVIRKRPDTGLLAHTWELPCVQGHLNRQQAKQQLNDWNITLLSLCEKESRRHIFTHITWELKVFLVEAACSRLPEGWVCSASPLQEAAVSSSFAKIIQENER
jgi:A/G-specific adenine glycosylase